MNPKCEISHANKARGSRIRSHCIYKSVKRKGSSGTEKIGTKLSTKTYQKIHRIRKIIHICNRNLISEYGTCQENHSKKTSIRQRTKSGAWTPISKLTSAQGRWTSGLFSGSKEGGKQPTNLHRNSFSIQQGPAQPRGRKQRQRQGMPNKKKAYFTGQMNRWKRPHPPPQQAPQQQVTKSETRAQPFPPHLSGTT